MPNRSSWRGALACALLLAVAVAPQVAQSATKNKAKPKADVTVMSRNLYLGAEIIKLAAVTTVDQEMEAAKGLHATVDHNNFPLRAKAIAKEIKQNKPDVIGLQEVARYYRGPDGVHDGIKNATTPLYDYLALLQKEIKARGLSYKVVSEQDWLDVEVPSADGYDLRLKMANVVLARSGKNTTVKVVKGSTGVFGTQLQDIPLPDGQKVHLTRGWAAMTGKVGGKPFLFVDPHAEAYSGDVAAKQFKELLKTGAKSKKLTTIIAGDFNSDPKSSNAGGYKAVIAAGFKDTAKRQSTCCQNETVDNTPSTLKQWIDHIVVRPKAKVLKQTVTGNKLTDRIGGLWPSDHAGIVARLRLQ